MPSRVLPQATREDETSTASTSPSFQSASPGLGTEKAIPEHELQSKSGTQHRESQSIAAEEIDLSSSTAAAHHQFEASTPPRPGAAPLVSKSENHQRPASSPSTLQASAAQRSQQSTSYFARQPRASGLDGRSPSIRRAPASRSSHGIETLSGPPPALITQRSYTGDNVWRYTNTVDLKEPVHQRPSINTRNTPSLADSDDLEQTSLEQSNEPEVDMASRRRARDRLPMEDDQGEATLRGIDFQQLDEARLQDQMGHDQLERQSQSSHEDLFLNLARADSTAGGDSDRPYSQQRRRSRVSLTGTHAPASYQPSAARQSEIGGKALPHQQSTSKREHESPSWQSSFFSHKASPDQGSNGSYKERPYTASTHPLDHKIRVSHSRLAPRASLNASRARRSSTRDPSPEPHTLGSGRHFNAEYSPNSAIPSFRQSDYLHTTPDQYNSSPLNGYPILGHRQVARRSSRADGTESTISTNAPSMILEQLDDLNSRIKRLELNGKMPSTSSAAMSSVLGERPTTATTTMTTMSPSPKHGQVESNSPEASTVKGPTDPNVRPLLHSALARCKDSIGVETFRALEATASDALMLATMTSSADSDQNNGSADNAASKGIDQRIRHKANSMCRSLTELCIALSDIKDGTHSSGAKSPLESIDTVTINQPSKPLTIEKARSSRAASLEPELRTSSRVMSRSEARRASQVALNAQLGRPEPSPFESSLLTQIPSSSTASRAPSVLIRRQTDEAELPASRALAITEIPQSHNHVSPQERRPREYKSQQRLPTYPQRSPSVQSSLPQRKSYFLNSNSNSPITPSSQPQDRRYLDQSTPPSSGTSRLAEMRQRREASERLNGGLGGAARAGLLNIRAGSADIRRAP